jgi:hypothetical protein
MAAVEVVWPALTVAGRPERLPALADPVIDEDWVVL